MHTHTLTHIWYSTCAYAYTHACADDLDNTALHIAVLHGHMDMVDWLVDNGAKQCMRTMNKQGLTPFTLSVWLEDIDMYAHIAQKFLHVELWKFGSCSLDFIDLDQIDSFRKETGSRSEGHDQDRDTGVQVAGAAEGEAVREKDKEEDHLHEQDGWRSAFEIIVEKEL